MGRIAYYPGKFGTVYAVKLPLGVGIWRVEEARWYPRLAGQRTVLTREWKGRSSNWCGGGR